MQSVKLKNGANIPVQAHSRKHEDDMAELLTYMVESISKSFKANTLKKLNKKTINKFADNAASLQPNALHMPSVEIKGEVFEFNDAQIGNYANIFLRLARQSIRQIKKRFTEKRIQLATNKILKQVDKFNAKNMYAKVEDIAGVSSKQLVAQEAMKATTNAYMLETGQWAKRLRDDILEQYVTNSLRAMSLGMGLDELTENFDVLTNKFITRAETNARTQVGTFNSLLTKTRAQNLGIKKAVWRTSEDEKVRPSHVDRSGKVFDLAEGCHSKIDDKYLLPGIDYNCRCDYILIIEDDEEEQG